VKKGVSEKMFISVGNAAIVAASLYAGPSFSARKKAEAAERDRAKKQGRGSVGR
jgi:hypothetical protein